MKKHIIKSIFLFILSLTVALTLIACNKPNENPETTPKQNSEETPKESTPNTPPEDTPCEHTFGEWKTEKEPTCEENGTNCSECTKCGEKKYDHSILPVGHSFENSICTVCESPDNYSKGLEFTASGIGTCFVRSLGACTDTDIRIPYRSPDGDLVTSIGEWAFTYNKNITSVALPNSITQIYNGAFNSCRSLKSINIPENVEYIGDFAFSECYCLESITLPDKITFISSGLLRNCSSLSEVIIPDGVNEIGPEAFYGCTSLEKIVVPSGVELIGENAFHMYGNNKIKYNQYDNALYFGNENDPYLILAKATDENITSCEIHSNTKAILDHAFQHCHLTSIVIPEGVRSLGKGAFVNCESLESVTIPDSIIRVGMAAFDQYGKVNFTEYGNAIYLGNEKNPHLVMLKTLDDSATSCEIHPDTKVIADEAFKGTDIVSVTIPNGVISIGNEAFRSCAGLTKIEIPDSTRFIFSEVFYECENLKTIVVGKSAERIDRNAFHSGYALESVIFANPGEWIVRRTNLVLDTSDPLQNARAFFYDHGPYVWVKKQ